MRWIIFLLLCAWAWAEPATLRVGILSFEDSRDLYKQLRAQSDALKKAVHLTPAFAIGTYGELFHWLENDLVDVAVINSGQLSKLSQEKWQYIGSATTSGHEPAYLSVCVVRKDSGLKSFEDVRAAGSRLRLLAVDPLSVSGFIHPVEALTKAGVQITPDQIKFSYSHTNSLRWLVQSDGPEMACIWASTWERNKDASLQEITIPGLDQLHSLPVALIARRGAPTTDSLARLVKSGGFPGFEFDPDYMQQVDQLPDTMPGSLAGLSGRPLDRVGIDDLILTMHLYNVTHEKPARLAVVLAGGGAKCSYQAGAVRALEERLQIWRKRLSDDQLDIRLVVGTSGGAINALSVAMGLTVDEDGYKALSAAWADLDQGEIICPPLAVRVNLWCWLACVTGLIILAVNWVFRLGKPRSMVLTGVVGAVMFGLSHTQLRFLLGTDSGLQHVWAWLAWGIEGAGVVLVMVCVTGFVTLHRDRRHRQVVHRTGPLVRLAIAGVTLLPILQAWTMFCYEEVVSENRGIESALTRNFGNLIQRQSRESGSVAGLSIAKLSQRVFEQNLLKRDVVLTASPLTDPELSLPGEFYFYASPLNSPEPGFGNRGIALVKRPELLFDALLGSAAIYPLFPSRLINDLPKAGQHVDLVDGSFAHRSPLEPAVLWGATHVLVIEASTLEPTTRGNLLNNFGASLTYLYDEAQLVDVRLRGQTVLYSLYPSAPHIGLLDFSPYLIKASIEKGYREASGAPTSAYQKGGALHKELGPPIFWTP
ncbi:PhnD/SsuA/transferrin family substrate-binding protein [bacterium]|nr:PhnD/SsuA/transferrin family substrate-binding protein [bacterium]